MSKNTIDIFLEKVQKGQFTFVLLDEKYALQQTNTVLASGMELESANEKIQSWYNEFANRAELLETVWNLVYQVKLNGVMFASIADTGNGDFDLDIAFPTYNNKMAKIYNNKRSAVLYKRPVDADNGIVIKEYWDTEKVVRKAYRQGDRISIDGLMDERGTQIKDVWYHNLGFLPVFEFKHRPKRLFITGAKGIDLYQQLAFDYAVKGLREEYNFSKTMGVLAEVLTVPRMVARLSASTIKKLKAKGGINKVLLNQLYLETDKVDASGKLAAGVELAQGNLESGVRDEHLDKIEKDYAEGCGSSYQRQDQSIQSATEVFYSNALEEKTATQDIKQIEDFMYQVLDALLVAKRVVPELNPQDREYTFTVRGNKILSDVDKVDLTIKKLQSGIITLKQAIIEIYNCTEDEAEERVQELEKQAEEKHQAAMELMSEFDNGQAGIKQAEE